MLVVIHYYLFLYSPPPPLVFCSDLDESEVFLVDQVSLCAALFALSIGEYALSADLSRFILKRQGSDADAGVWILRGLAFVAMGK